MALTHHWLNLFNLLTTNYDMSFFFVFGFLCVLFFIVNLCNSLFIYTEIYFCRLLPMIVIYQVLIGGLPDVLMTTIKFYIGSR